MLIARKRVQKILTSLGERGVTFSEIEIVPFGDSVFGVNLRQGDAPRLLAENAQAGVDTSIEIATLKALSEFFERNAWKAGQNNAMPLCQGGTDGFAAFPTPLIPRFIARRRAREAAFTEAIEHYVKAHWWDNNSIGHTLETHSQESFKNTLDRHCQCVLAELNKTAACRRIQILLPALASENYEVVVVLWWFDGGGVTLAGACGRKGKRNKTLFRALTELFRHVLVVARAKSERLQPEAAYDARLLHFGFGAGDDAVFHRLSTSGETKVSLPVLRVDSEVPHAFPNLAVVWRCLFENQPEFLSGPIERLCL
jgi:hypothetical protein